MRIISLITFLSITSFLFSNPLWMRYSTISPDGNTVAFTYQGNIYTVPVSGGEAYQVTQHTSYDYKPVWSPDGNQLAFASNRFGNFDIFIVSKKGGSAKRLTFNSVNEIPLSFTPDGKELLFGAAIQAPTESAAFPSGVMSQVFAVNVSTNLLRMVMPVPADAISFHPTVSKFIYQDRKGQENKFRKHHTSAVTRDIWSFDIAKNSYTQLTTKAGEDTDPVYAPDGKSYFFLSERNGTFNVYSASIDTPDQPTQITFFKTNPVRFLSISKNGTLCFGYDGEIYTKTPNSEPAKLKISIVTEPQTNDVLFLTNENANAQSVSSDGKQIALTMRGEIFVTSADYKFTKQISFTAGKEDYPSFSPDGKTLLYASQRQGNWNIYQAKVTGNNDLFFFNATVLDEQAVFEKSSFDRSVPKYSPDGKEIAYIEDRNKLMVYTIKTKKSRQIVDSKLHPSTDGEFSYNWSPDSKWIVMTYTPNKHEPYYDIGLVSAEGGEITNLTNSGYMNLNPRWMMNGNAIIFTTERYGMRNHASWGSLYDVMAIFLNQEAYEQFQLDKDEAGVLKEEKTAIAKKEPEKKSKKEAADSTNKENVKDIVVDLKNIEDRFVRLTPNSMNISDAVLTKDNVLYYTASFEKGYDLWSYDCRTREPKLELKDLGRGELYLDSKEANLFALGSTIQKIGIPGSKKTTISYTAKAEIDLAAERAYMFEQVWSQEKRRFYNIGMHGVDWDLMHSIYVKFLPHINNNFDFSEMLSEMLGELNVSHTGSGYRPRIPNSDDTAELGLLFSWNSEKLVVDEVIEKGPFDKADSKMKKGSTIQKIDGVDVTNIVEYYSAMNKKAGQRVLITFNDGKSVWNETVIPASTVSNLLYDRWVKQRAADVERLSKGRLGYVHIQSMADPSFRSIYSDILGKYNNKEAIVIDTRFNGGGRMHEDIEILFSGKKYFTQVVRGVETCDMPSRRWNKPSIMITGEANYSNAHGTPWVYRFAGIGKIVGMPVPGTMTSVNWETLIDPTLYFGIPIVGYELADGTYLENQQLEPDYKIANSPAKYTVGTDEQLEMAVKVMLDELDK